MYNAANGIRRRFYLVTGAHTLAASLIWGVNTLFLLGSGLSVFQAFLVNAIFTAAMTLFEIPTGAVADARGRRVSLRWSAVFLLLGTLGYLAAGTWNGGVWGFAVASVVLGIGYTFFSGAAEAWVVDELKSVGEEAGLERLFARSGMTASATMLIGTIIGGILGTVDLRIPYIIRAGLFVIMLGITLFGMTEKGWKPDGETMGAVERIRRTATDSMAYGWRVKSLRRLMTVSLILGSFMMWGFYALQPYVTGLAGRPGAAWIAGVVTAMVSLSQMGGQALAGRRSPASGTGPSLVAGRLAGAIGVSAFGAFLVGAAGLPFVAAWIGRGGSLALCLGGLLLMMGSIGYYMPFQRSAFHRRIPSEKRATVLSLDSLVGNAGAIVGQPILGRVTDGVGFPAGYFTGTALTLLTLPVLAAFGRSESEENRSGTLDTQAASANSPL